MVLLGKCGAHVMLHAFVRQGVKNVIFSEHGHVETMSLLKQVPN